MEAEKKDFEQPPGSLLIVCDPATGDTKTTMKGPLARPASIVNALELAKVVFISQQLQQQTAPPQQQSIMPAPAGFQVPRNRS